MKKIISLLLALLMIFSVVTVAFAEDVTPDDDPAITDTEDTADEEFDPMELPLWTVKVGLKLGKVAVKIISVLVKLADTFGLIDLKQMLIDLLDQIQNADQTPADDVVDVPADQVAA